MSYDIYIGETVMEPYDDEDVEWMLENGWMPEHVREVDGKKIYYQQIVNEIHVEEAPTFPNDGMTGNGNDRHPGYSQWSDFCRTAGIYNLFFNPEDGLMREHPGIQSLHAEHALCIEQALTRWKEGHPNAVPGFSDYQYIYRGPDVGYVDELQGPVYDPILARLIWLDFWVKWALKNCEAPAIYNH